MKFNWGHGIVIFFVIFLIWIISFVIFTLGENHDLVTKDYYRQGAEFSKHMKIYKRSVVYNDSVYVKNSRQGVTVSFAQTILAKASKKEVYFYRHSDKNDDVIFKLEEGQPSLTIPADKLKKGRYKISVSWKMNDEFYKVDKDFNVKTE